MLNEVSSSVPTTFTPEQIEHAFSSATVADLERLLSASPGAHALVFWHNMTPLHLACMRSNEPSAVARLLLGYGAAIDRVNAFGETPLMFACKRGVPELVALLLSAGADPLARDSAGRGLVHHAAMSGSTAVVHFLRSSVLNVSCKDVDGRRQTPLHIVASMGHIDLLRYLLRQRQGDARVDVQASDVFGNTALHVAASNGHPKITWELLVKGGKQLVLAENKEGRTPLDLAQQLNSWKHRETLQLLRHARKLCATRSEFEGPVAAWYWHLAMPTCLSLVALAIAKLLQGWTGGHSGALLLVAALLAVAAIAYRHSHRMEHICDWPNPVYAGAFGGGMLVTTVCHVHLLWSSLSDRFLLLIYSSALILSLLHTYHRLLFGDPGFVDFGRDECSSVNCCRDGTHSNGATDLGPSGVRLRAAEVATSKVIPPSELFCAVCEIYREDDVKHCRLCDRCVLAMDHHCLYLMRCVAGKNHRRFVVFIALVLLSQLTFLSTAWLYIELTFLTLPAVTIDAGTLRSDDFAVSVIATLLRTEFFLSAMVVLNALSAVWGVSVFGWQLKLVARGQTYYKSVKCEDEAVVQVSVQDQLRNLLNFFTGRTAHSNASCRRHCCTTGHS